MAHCVTLPIIALTANAFSEDRQACSDAGMDDFLSKPVEPERLAEVLARWIPAGAKEASQEALAEVEPCATLDDDQLQDFRVRLEGLLAQGDTECVSLLERETALAEKALGAAYEDVRKSIARFDFERALAALDQKAA